MIILITFSINTSLVITSDSVMGKQLNFKRPVGVYIIIPGLYIVVLLSQSDDYNIQEKKTVNMPFFDVNKP